MNPEPLRPQRVLLVEDQAGDALLIAEFLATDVQSKWAIDRVARLEDACDCLAQGRYDAVLLDLGLPDSVGVATVEQVCRRAPETPIVVLTDRADDAIGILAVQAGAQEFHSKLELSPQMLARTLRYAIERKRLQVQLADLGAFLEASRLKSEFLANVSHELRTPLNVILGFATLLEDGSAGPLSAKQADYLNQVLTGARRLQGLITDILDLASAESERIEIRAGPFHPAETIVEVRNALGQVAISKGIEVQVEVAPDLGEVVGDALRLWQVLQHFLSNALKFTPAGGSVTIRAQRKGDGYRIEVEDNGPGIEPAQIGRLFVDFQQLDSSTSKAHPGAGVGLALVKKVVEAQGGEVGVRSTPGVGSVFFAELPAQPRQAAG